MNPAAPDGAPPQRISAGKHMCKHCTAPPCPGEALRQGALIKLQGFMIFYGSGENHPCSCPFQQKKRRDFLNQASFRSVT